jgi:hypothetical protein
VANATLLRVKDATLLRVKDALGYSRPL